MKSTRIQIDPDDVFVHPWRWKAVARHDASFRSALTPVVAVFGGPNGWRAGLLGESVLSGLVCGPLDDPTTKFFIQTMPQGLAQALVDAQNAAMKNPRYAPDPVSGTTHCSEATLDIARRMGLVTSGILADARGQNYDANTQIKHLAEAKNGYAAVTPDRAQALGDEGVVVFVTQHGTRHGHIATVRPQDVPGDNPLGKSGPLLANIGQFNGVAHQSKVFTPAHGAIVYYAPNR